MQLMMVMLDSRNTMEMPHSYFMALRKETRGRQRTCSVGAQFSQNFPVDPKFQSCSCRFIRINRTMFRRINMTIFILHPLNFGLQVTGSQHVPGIVDWRPRFRSSDVPDFHKHEGLEKQAIKNN